MNYHKQARFYTAYGGQQPQQKTLNNGWIILDVEKFWRKLYKHSEEIRDLLDARETERLHSTTTILVMKCISEPFEVYDRFELNQIVNVYEKEI